MSSRSQWKMLHLLYTYGKPTLTRQRLEGAGIHCYDDTIQYLIGTGVVIQDRPDEYSLSMPARVILNSCVVANRRWDGDDLLVDVPRAFVIMPFSQPWSSDVYHQMIRPAVEDAGLECVRGDTNIRVGDLARNIWNELLLAGIIIADVSALNANVFYEVGLAHALGKDVFILKQKTAVVPADFGGAHYYEYDQKKLTDARDMLRDALKNWAADPNVQASGVKALK